MRLLNLVSKLNRASWCRSKRLMDIIGKRHCSSHQSRVDLLVELTGCSNEMAQYTVNNSLKKFSIAEPEKMKKTFSLLMNYGFRMDDIIKNLVIFAVHPTTLKNQYLMLEECGIKPNKINCHSILHFYHVSKLAIDSLRKQGYLDQNVNVGVHCLNLLGLPFSNQGSEFIKGNTVVEIHISVLNELLKLKFDGLWDGTEKINKRLHYKSLRLISRTFDLLTNECDLPKERVKSSQVLLSIIPESIEEILEKAPILCDCDIRELIKLWPKVLMNNCNALLQINEHLKEFGITREAALSTPAIFTLHPDNIHKRLINIKNDPELNQWLYHPKILRMLMYQKKVYNRLNIIQEANVKCLSLHLFQAPETEFKKRVDHIDKSNHHDLVTLLSMTLSVDKVEIRKRLKKHPYWLYIPHKDVQTTLYFLKDEGFTNEQIANSVILLLYPRNVIQEQLSKLDSIDEFKSCYIPGTRKLREDTVLPLLLYSLEKPFHFSKEGVWAHKNKEIDPLKSSTTH